MTKSKHGKSENMSISHATITATNITTQTLNVSQRALLPKLSTFTLDSGSVTAPICGVATIAVGDKVVTVPTTAVLSTDLIFLTPKLSATAANDGLVMVSNNIIEGVSFAIQASAVTTTDPVLVDWMIVHRS